MRYFIGFFSLIVFGFVVSNVYSMTVNERITTSQEMKISVGCPTSIQYSVVNRWRDRAMVRMECLSGDYETPSGALNNYSLKPGGVINIVLVCSDEVGYRPELALGYFAPANRINFQCRPTDALDRS